MCSKRRTFAVLISVLVSMSVWAPSFLAAADAVIGSVNPTTGQTTLFTDRLKTQFPDGGPIAHLYLVARPNPPGGYALVRAGRLATGACHTELIAVQVSGNDVVLPRLVRTLFSCEDIDGRCHPKPDNPPVFCVVDDAVTGCACKPSQFAANPPGPDCERVNELLWNLERVDIVWQ
jgi:hypothetical protein